MGKHSVAEAKNRLPELINRALAGEGVIITRHGKPVVELKPIVQPAKPVTAEDIEWVSRRRVGKKKPARQHAGDLLRTMRDEEWR
jgi:prevent-host-death family protein